MNLKRLANNTVDPNPVLHSEFCCIAIGARYQDLIV